MELNSRGPRLNPDRDPEILAWIGRHGIVTSHQLARHFFGGYYPLAARNAQRLGRMGLIERHHTFQGQPDALFLTRDGKGVAEVDLNPVVFRYVGLRHAVLLVDLMEELAAQHPHAEMLTEREIRRDWRRKMSHPPGRYPDGMFLFPDNLTVGVELDLTAKRSRLLAELFTDYTTTRLVTFSAVWWFAPPGIVPLIRKVVREQRFVDLIQVFEWKPGSFGA